MANEALCKILAHNICFLIQSHYELGVEAKSWEAEEEPKDVVESSVSPDLFVV